MDARTWAMAKTLLADAAELPPSARTEFLETHCPDPGLRAELLAMLAEPAPLSQLIAPPTLRPGATLGAYVIQTLLGRGGMGEVYRARDSRLGREVAIKVLPADVANDPDRLHRFEREAQLLAALNHPHIATIHGLERAEGTTFLVLELVSGNSLAERLAKGPMKRDEALQTGIDILDALQAAHRAGIVHRDLKPGNVMLGANGAKLLDFGLAKSSVGLVDGVAMDSASAITAPGTIMGTLPYMAPEQIEGKEADARTDIFAFGCVLYEMLTGRPPFEGRTPASLIAAILERDPPGISSFQPTLPPALDRLVNRCLAKDPAARWQTTTDLLSELTWITAGGVRVDRPRAGRPRRPWVLWTLTAASTGACLIMALMWRVRPAPAAGPPLRTLVLSPKDQKIVAHGVAFSPDGTRVAFRTFPQGEFRAKASSLWVHSLADGSATQIPNSSSSFYPFFSPDGRHLGFCTNWENVQTVDLSSGVLTTVATGGCWVGTWNNSGTILFSRRGSIYDVPASGGTAGSVLLRRSDLAFEAPTFLPDGRHFLVVGNSPAKDTGGVYVADLQTHDARLLIAGGVAATFAAPGFLLYQREPRTALLLAQPFDVRNLALTGSPTPIAPGVSDFAASPDGVLAYLNTGGGSDDFVWMSRNGAILGRVAQPSQGSPAHPRLSPDGSRLAYEMLTGGQSTGIWVSDLVRDLATPITSDDDRYAIWSPDGTQLVFTRAYSELRRKLATGAGEDQGVLKSAQAFPRDWSPDGREIIYGRGSGALGLLRLSPRSDTALLPSTTFDNWDAQFSPDGHWLAYSSSEAGGNDVYVMSYPELTDKWKVSTEGGAEPRWCRDGRELFYIDPDRRVMSVAIGHDGQTLTLKKPVPLFQTSIVNELEHSYDVSPDGQRFVVTVAREPAQARPLHIVTNWTALLKK